MEIYTIGYEGVTIEDFIATITKLGIAHIIDVRDVPASRKKGFSKNSFKSALAEVGILYTHLKPLGDPKEGREAMRRGDRAAFERVFAAHMSLEEAKKAMVDAKAIASESRAALLCFERDPKFCHRSIVAKKIAGDGFKVRHIGVAHGH
jgi:uncharacterized protein (DUF488 family)